MLKKKINFLSFSKRLAAKLLNAAINSVGNHIVCLKALTVLSLFVGSSHSKYYSSWLFVEKKWKTATGQKEIAYLVNWLKKKK